jgi:hypothetical protein
VWKLNRIKKAIIPWARVQYINGTVYLYLSVFKKTTQRNKPIYILTQTAIGHTKLIASDIAHTHFDNVPECFAVLSSRE